MVATARVSHDSHDSHAHEVATDLILRKEVQRELENVI
ncbi:protein of unknown function [Acidithiobacillus ferrivorans]|uniref:Uncharacterized protein n=1 Tax=Acidithiobacillus ferrivorans TaxID=160808 RepID=A0ABY1MLG3_9PROT|nr:protein of unknown function [Acidithiobacillus ferrivorans]